MLAKTMAAAAAATMAATPVMAAELPRLADDGARRSGAVASVYYKIPLGGGGRAKAPHGGLKLSMMHDYRHAGAQTARVVEADGLDLRFDATKKASFWVAGRRFHDAEARKRNFGPVSTAVTVVIVVAAVVGGYYIVRAIDDSGGE